MSNELSKILSLNNKITKKESVIKPLQDEVDSLRSDFLEFLYDFLTNVLEKRKKYYFTEEHELRWMMFRTVLDDRQYGHPPIFTIETKTKARGSQIFEEILFTEQLYDIFKNTIRFKELVRESAIETVLDDK